MRTIKEILNLSFKLATTSFKAKYTGLKLGVWVAVMNPLLLMFAVTFVFTRVVRLDIENFPLFALAGIFPWMFLSSALSEAVHAIMNNQGVLRQFRIAALAIPASVGMANFLVFLIGWIIIYPIFAVHNSNVLPLFPVFALMLVLLFLFVSGLGFLFSALNVFWRDLGQMLGVWLMLWFWITPVFYPLEMVPDRYMWVCLLNPATYFIVAFREILFRARVPDLNILSICAVLAAASLLLGVRVFTSLEREFLRRL